jgi:hypothetical protein
MSWHAVERLLMPTRCTTNMTEIVDPAVIGSLGHQDQARRDLGDSGLTSPAPREVYVAFVPSRNGGKHHDPGPRPISAEDDSCWSELLSAIEAFSRMPAPAAVARTLRAGGRLRAAVKQAASSLRKLVTLPKVSGHLAPTPELHYFWRFE